MSTGFKRSELPTVDDLSTGNSFTVSYTVGGYFSRNNLEIVVTPDRNQSKGNRLQIYPKLRAVTMMSHTSEACIASLESFSNAMVDANEVVQHIRELIPQAEEHLDIVIEEEKRRRREWELADAEERRLDRTYGIKQARRIVKEMHAACKKLRSYRYTEKLTFAPSGLDRPTFYVECGRKWGRNCYFYLNGYTSNRKEVTEMIANASENKTLLARLKGDI